MNSSPLPAIATVRSATLGAVVGRVLPGIHGPGAASSSAAAAFEEALQHPCLRGLRPGVEALLDRLTSEATRLHGNAFEACTPEQQDDLLGALERDPNPWTRFTFRSLIGFSLEGLLGDPIHGGNRDFVGWASLGLRTEDVRSGFCAGAEQRC